MPPLPLPLLDCAVYLYTDRPAAEDSEKFGGSGFVVWVPIKGRPDGGTAYVVTNRHVGPKFPAIRFNTRDGETDIQTAGIWHEHSEADLAVAEVTLAPAHQTARIPLDLFLSEADRSWYQVGTETASVGRFVKHDGKQRNTPVVRFGNIAMLPGEPVQVDGNLPAQVGFLVESRSIPGYSGSPVFAYFPHPHTSGAELRSPPIAGISTRLLGVTWGHIRDNVKVEGKHAELNTGMAAVVPAWRLTDLLLNDPKVVAMRDEGEREWLEENPEPPAGVPDVAEKPDEWDRDDFMRDLERATQPTEPGDKSQPGKA